jgi:hypothetical protein
MIWFREVTKQDRLATKIMTAISGTVLALRKGMPYDDIIKNGLNHDTLMGLIDFGISEGTFMPSYTFKKWLDNTRKFLIGCLLTIFW